MRSLQSVHNYVFVEESLLPYGTALKRLWDLLFTSTTVASARCLADLFGKHPTDTVGVTYAQAFQGQFQQRWPITLAQLGDAERQQRLQQLARCLDSHELTRDACWSLVTSGDPPLRDLARLVLIPLLALALTMPLSHLRPFGDPWNHFARMTLWTPRLPSAASSWQQVRPPSLRTPVPRNWSSTESCPVVFAGSLFDAAKRVAICAWRTPSTNFEESGDPGMGPCSIYAVVCSQPNPTARQLMPISTSRLNALARPMPLPDSQPIWLKKLQ